MGSITHWLRLEPRPRSNAIGGSLAAEIRDPAWFLARQWQLAEFAGTDGGSAAWFEYVGRSSQIPRFTIGGTTRSAANAPLEPQTLVELFAPDGTLQVELGQSFADILAAKVQNVGTTQQLIDNFLKIDLYRFKTILDTDELNPLDPSTLGFLTVCADRSLDGYQLYLLGKNGAQVPSAVTTNPGEIAKVRDALLELVTRTEDAYGVLGTTDPEAWTAERLEYAVKVVAASPTAGGNETLTAEPDSDGEYDWSSFDVIAKNGAATENPPKPVAFTMIPADARFPGMPNPRLWMFESNEVAFADLDFDKRDLMKLVVADFMLVQGNNWYCLPLLQDVGTLVTTDRIVVVDVFGHQTLVERADREVTTPGTNRWTMFSNTDVSAVDGTETLSKYFLLPPTSGPHMQLGEVLEDVRFGRDEMANMAWGIERFTESPIGEPRSGRERDAAVAKRQNFPEPEPVGDAPLRYLIETKVPINWIPLVPVQPSPPNPSIALEKAAALHPKMAATPGGQPTVAAVQATGRILSPTNVAPYQIQEEEIPRDGTRVERVVFRTRWYDGSTYLWVQRRRLASAGESQAGLRFDQALPNQR
jgi:hypothetical protein